MSDALFDLPQQPELVTAPVRARTVDSTISHPVAKVCLDVPFSWPDTLYDYEIPESLDSQAQVGTRVRVTFGRKRVTGLIVARESTTTARTLAPILQVTGLPCTSPSLIEFYQRVATQQVAPLHDVLRSAIPPRHARGEQTVASLAAPVFPHYDDSQPSTGELWIAAHDPYECAAEHAYHVVARGGQVLIVAPTGVQVEKLARAVGAFCPDEPIGKLVADQSPEVRYRHHMAILNGHTRLVIGTRAAIFAPLSDVSAIIVIDETDEAMRDKRSPYSWAHEVARMRQPDLLVHLGFPPHVTTDLPEIRSVGSWPRVSSTSQWPGDQRGILPPAAFDIIRQGLSQGPVLVTAPRAGYVPALSCMSCGERAECDCGTPLAVPRPGAEPSCHTCGSTQWQCSCGSRHLRARRRGSERLAHELAQAFHCGIDIVRSTRETSDAPLVISTPGAEPLRDFAAGVILEPQSYLSTVALDAISHSLRAWHRVRSRVRAGGHVLLAGPVPDPLVDAFNHHSVGIVGESFEDRHVLGQPPFHRWFAISGPHGDVRQLISRLCHLYGRPEAPDSLAQLLSGGGHELTPGIFLLGPTMEGEIMSLYLHEEQPAHRLRDGLRQCLSSRLRIRLEADPIL